MLEMDDIQHMVLVREPAQAGRYDFVTFGDPVAGRRWVSAMTAHAASVTSALAAKDTAQYWLTLGFTWNGLRALGLDDETLESFPRAFREGMAARAEILGDVGANAPEHWADGLAEPDLHAIAVWFTRELDGVAEVVALHDRVLAACPGVELTAHLDLVAVPPFGFAHDHFGYRDRLSQPEMEGTGIRPTPGSGPPIKAGEFLLGYADESGVVPVGPQPAELVRNGTYMAYRRLREHVGRFRDFLAEHGETEYDRELLAAKLMGRWRSGAPLVLAPTEDDPELGKDPQRNNDFGYQEQDPHGYAVPLGAHIRRMNPRDTAPNMNRRRMIRRGATYGPPLPEGQPDDGADRGIAAFILCADLVRQFEFAQNVWTNDKDFHELGNEHDPITGAQDGTLDFTIPRRPIKKVIRGLPAFTTVTGGAYFFVPGMTGLRYLADQPTT